MRGYRWTRRPVRGLIPLRQIPSRTTDFAARGQAPQLVPAARQRLANRRPTAPRYAAREGLPHPGAHPRLPLSFDSPSGEVAICLRTQYHAILNVWLRNSAVTPVSTLSNLFVADRRIADREIRTLEGLIAAQDPPLNVVGLVPRRGSLWRDA